MSLRPYQQKTIDMLYDWIEKNDGNPCVVLPTGAGKSHVIAHLCKNAITEWPDTRVLMLTHVKELIEQNADKLRAVWPNAPLGIYSAGLRRRDIDVITFAGIQSVRNRAQEIGFIDLVIVDECHLISHKAEGGYRTLLEELIAINPRMRVIGLTATPFRMGHGYIVDGDTIFDDLIEPVNIEQLVDGGYLAPLRSKLTTEQLDVGDVAKRGGEYVESELARAIDKNNINAAVVSEVIQMAGDRKAWLFFCAGVDHARHIRDELRDQGVVAECVTGDTPKAEREAILGAYKRGQIKALTNANVLTTGFDYPDIDLIAMLRPTMSPGLYVQMAGRGMRLKNHTDHCMVLDFAGVVSQHGPVTKVRPPASKDDEERGEKGEAPVKVCDECHELVHPTVKICPSCNTPFPEPKKAPPKLHNDDIMGDEQKELEVNAWRWEKHISRKSGKEMIKVSYYGDLSRLPVREYLPITHEGYPGNKARATVLTMMKSSGLQVPEVDTIDDICRQMNEAQTPAKIKYTEQGKFYNVTQRLYETARA